MNVDRQTAWGYCTANLALPGSGSAAGGRKIGYAQMTLAFLGLGVSLVSGVRFIVWGLKNLPHFYDASADPLDALQELWRAARWPLAGLGLFALAWLWALVTSLSLFHQAKPGGASEPGHWSPPPAGGAGQPPAGR
ncbi:MAG TPA: hypothetical protein VMB80_12155 [Candidatus Acidoferrum sp.]|nr:hypothetical protein [Candidatus Acidoferrum sp.]